MNFKLPKTLGLLLGALALIGLASLAGLSLFMLMNAALSLWLVLWVFLPLVCVPLVAMIAYRLYGLLTANYRLDRNGLYIRWGFSEERLPIGSIESVSHIDRHSIEGAYPRTFRWPGLVIGRGSLLDGSRLEFFSSAGMDDMLLVRSDHGAFAITPRLVDDFLKHFQTALRSGSLEQWEHYSRRPQFVLARLWADRWARTFILIGALLPLLLLAFLAAQAPGLPPQVPFGFDAAGMPETFAPPARLLLLPLSAGLCWMTDLVLGWWSYRHIEHRVLAYVMWGFSILVGGLFWGATLHLLAAA